jgi:hypothetical protein
MNEHATKTPKHARPRPVRPASHIDLKEPFEVSLARILALPKGTKIMRTGILQSEDMAEMFTKPLVEMDQDPGLLPKAVSYGPPTDEEVREALQALYDAKERPMKEFRAVHPKSFGDHPYPPEFFIPSQGNFLACAQSRSDFAKDQPQYCYDTLLVTRDKGEIAV